MRRNPSTMIMMATIPFIVYFAFSSGFMGEEFLNPSGSIAAPDSVMVPQNNTVMVPQTAPIQVKNDSEQVSTFDTSLLQTDLDTGDLLS